jgi:hypothetical protein
MLRCDGCGVERDPEALEVYPHPEDGITDEPIPPFFDVDCQPGDADVPRVWRTVRVCHACFHRLGPDMWIDRRGWEAISPAVPFEQLKEAADGK